jgi:hypothetical protein
MVFEADVEPLTVSTYERYLDQFVANPQEESETPCLSGFLFYDIMHVPR